MSEFKTAKIKTRKLLKKQAASIAEMKLAMQKFRDGEPLIDFPLGRPPIGE